MIALGATLHCNLPPRHIWVVLSNPQRTGGDILMVNMTTLTEDCIDDLCILGPEDFGLLTHKTSVAYSRHRAGPVAGLQELINNGSFSVISPVPPTTPQRILDGARRSPQIPENKKALLG
jgi:hypothetical protein